MTGPTRAGPVNSSRAGAGHALDRRDRETLGRRFDRLGGLGSEVPIDRVLAAGLGDHDPRGRLAVLTSGLTIPREVLFDRATNDASPIVRAEALAQLPRKHPRFEIVARTALADQDEGVRDIARTILTALQAPPTARHAERAR